MDGAEGLSSAGFRRLHEGTSIRRATGLPLADRLLAIWYRRDVLRMLTERGLKAKYSQSVLGYAWSLIEPAMLIVTYFLLLKVFHRTYPDYPLFVGSTVLAWQWFNGTVNASLTSLRRNSRLITSVNLPREIYPLSDVAQEAIEYVLSLPVLLVVAAFYGVKPSGFLLALPLVLVLELLLCTGFALLVAALNTVLRDIQRGIGIVLRLMFYTVPVLYPLYNLNGTAQRIASINPLVGILEVQRAIWFPAFWTGWRPLWFSVVGSLVVFVAGFAVFTRVERTVLKEL